jgi:hypothetical protein
MNRTCSHHCARKMQPGFVMKLAEQSVYVQSRGRQQLYYLYASSLRQSRLNDGVHRHAQMSLQTVRKTTSLRAKRLVEISVFDNRCTRSYLMQPLQRMPRHARRRPAQWNSMECCIILGGGSQFEQTATLSPLVISSITARYKCM